MIDKFWTKWQLWPKNVITQILQCLYNFISTLDGGHDVHQVSDEAKANVPEHIRQAAREMNRKAYKERLREIKMSEFDANLYEEYAGPVRRQVTALKNIINGLQAKAKERQWWVSC